MKGVPCCAEEVHTPTVEEMQELGFTDPAQCPICVQYLKQDSILEALLELSDQIMMAPAPGPMPDVVRPFHPSTCPLGQVLYAITKKSKTPAYGLRGELMLLLQDAPQTAPAMAPAPMAPAPAVLPPAPTPASGCASGLTCNLWASACVVSGESQEYWACSLSATCIPQQLCIHIF